MSGVMQRIANVTALVAILGGCQYGNEIDPEDDLVNCTGDWDCDGDRYCTGVLVEEEACTDRNSGWVTEDDRSAVGGGQPEDQPGFWCACAWGLRLFPYCTDDTIWSIDRDRRRCAADRIVGIKLDAGFVVDDGKAACVRAFDASGASTSTASCTADGGCADGWSCVLLVRPIEDEAFQVEYGCFADADVDADP
jgi:hypothetical protein